jgi:hypothetical protein
MKKIKIATIIGLDIYKICPKKETEPCLTVAEYDNEIVTAEIIVFSRDMFEGMDEQLVMASLPIALSVYFEKYPEKINPYMINKDKQ